MINPWVIWLAWLDLCAAGFDAVQPLGRSNALARVTAVEGNVLRVDFARRA